MFSGYERWKILRHCSTRPISTPERSIVIADIAEDNRILSRGKLIPALFLPPFIDALRDHRIETYLASSNEEARHQIATGKYCALVCIIGEDKPNTKAHLEELTKLERDFPDTRIFNRPSIAPILANKRKSLELFVRYGIDIPGISPQTGQKFSYPETGSGHDARVVEECEISAPQELETELIGTRIEFQGREYYTCTRIRCINQVIVDTLVRARPVSENNPAVHNNDTPLDAKLIHRLYDQLIRPNRVVLDEICAKLHRALGDGFYGHDALIEPRSGRIAICESGFKFEDFSTFEHLRPIAPELPMYAGFFNREANIREAARVFSSTLKPTCS